MTSNFCKYLSNQVRIEYGQLKPCCWFTESVDVSNSQQVKLFKQELDSIVDWESAKGRCDECQRRETLGIFSPRLQSLSRKTFDGVTNSSAISVEIQIDKDCNGGCLICGPWNSTTWEKYQNKINNIPIKDITDTVSNNTQFIKTINQNVDFSNAREVLFLGGEPLRTDSHLALLQNITTPGDTIVKYITNGSYRPDQRTLLEWKKYKEIHLIVSVDGIGDHFNYLRWPLQWSQVESNIQYLLDLSDSNIKLSAFSYTTTPFSLFYHDRYEAWAKEFFESTHINYRNMFSQPWQPRGQTPMLLAAVPPKLQDEIRSKYGPDHAITKLLEPFDIRQYSSFMQYINYHDKHRGTSWRETFPEMVPFFLFKK